MKRNKEILFALQPLLNETEDRVIDDLTNQIERIYKDL